MFSAHLLQAPDISSKRLTRARVDGHGIQDVPPARHGLIIRLRSGRALLSGRARIIPGLASLYHSDEGRSSADLYSFTCVEWC
eukprot:12890012-Prorocentrum_lima.AAC.1